MYNTSLFDRMEDTIFMPAQLSYKGPMSLIFLRNYPLSEEDRWHYYAYEDASVTSIYLEPSTALPVSSTDNLFSYSETMGCAEILMQTAPVFLRGEFDRSQTLQLKKNGIQSIWGEDNVLFYTQENAALTLLSESGGDSYTLQYAQ